MTAQGDEEGSNLVTKTIGFDEIATKVVNLEVAGYYSNNKCGNITCIQHSHNIQLIKNNAASQFHKK